MPYAPQAPIDVDVPLHPLLPGGASGQFAPPPGGELRAHQSPHAASAGPQDGARGAMWFAVLTFLIILVSLIGAALLRMGG
ncbi:MAG TPA: hypothetical protein VMM13_20905 [Euzebya sp.]|nr:hypothetical protein [Euzebya sp.]